MQERARSKPEDRFTSLAHYLTVGALRRSYERLNKDSAVGIDGVSKAEYGKNLDSRLEDLHRRLKDMKYRASPTSLYASGAMSGSPQQPWSSCLKTVAWPVTCEATGKAATRLCRSTVPKRIRSILNGLPPELSTGRGTTAHIPESWCLKFWNVNLIRNRGFAPASALYAWQKDIPRNDWKQLVQER